MKRYFILLILFAIGCSTPNKPLADWQAKQANDALLLEELPVETDFENTSLQSVSLDGLWQAKKDTQEVGINERWFAKNYDMQNWDSQVVPGTYNLDEQGRLDPYKGAVWLSTNFDLQRFDATKNSLLLRFGGCFLKCRYWLNGVELGNTERPYLPVVFDVSDSVIIGENKLTVMVDNRITRYTVPVDTIFNQGKHGWWPYGGLTRTVDYRIAPRVRIWDLSALTECSDAGDKLSIQLGIYNPDRVDSIAGLTVVLQDPDGNEIASWSGERIELPYALNRLTLVDSLVARRWSREEPGNLYTISVKLGGEAGDVEYQVRFGFRQVEARADGLYINGRRDFLYGINRHEDSPTTGPWQPDEHLVQDLQLIGELGVNHIRPGHYPAEPRWLRLLRDAGITIEEEIPVYQWANIQMADQDLIDKAVVLLRAMIQRDRNNPAIIAWSLANEVHSWEDEADDFARQLNEAARTDDPDRLTTFALLTVPAVGTGKEYIAPYVDFIGLNEYYGWYYGAIDDVSDAIETYHAMFPDKPLIMSEFGAGAVYGTLKGGTMGPEPADDHSYTEDWQAWFIAGHLRNFRELGYLAGTMPWAFADFHMEWNPTTGSPHPVDQTNLKGLVSFTREKKLSFDVVSEAYLDRVFDQ